MASSGPTPLVRLANKTFAMFGRSLLLLSLLLLSTSGAAKKLYKYQDQNGIWHYSDKPPATEQPVEIRQLKPARKQRVRLEKGGNKYNPAFYAINQYPGPVEIAVDWEDQNNVISSPPLPQRFVVGPGKSTDLFDVRGAETTQSWRFTLKYQYLIGEPLVNYVSSTPYLPPISPNSRFRITQAFNGQFSHQDKQNRYAVDIVMPVGTPIHAARSGVVLEVENDYFKGGTQQAYANKANSVRILHEDGSMAVYAHLQLETAQVHPGLEVQAGELIAYSGNTGYSSGPHLHFAVQVNQGMQLASVPFKFATPGGRAITPQQGAWLEGFMP